MADQAGFNTAPLVVRRNWLETARPVAGQALVFLPLNRVRDCGSCAFTCFFVTHIFTIFSSELVTGCAGFNRSAGMVGRNRL